MDMPSLRNETRYGMPAADQILFNRDYVLGYSYYFRQAKWALEIIDPDGAGERQDNFRADFRIPEMFRADLVDYSGSGFDRGHLVASANHRDSQLQNSETFLLSNMSPQHPRFNRDIWREVEGRIRDLNDQDDVLETYVLSGPVFYYDKPIQLIGSDDSNQVSIPVPHAYFKSVLAETDRGRLHMWSFVLKNQQLSDPLARFQVPTSDVERLCGVKLWERLVGKWIEKEKAKKRTLWF